MYRVSTAHVSPGSTRAPWSSSSSTTATCPASAASSRASSYSEAEEAAEVEAEEAVESAAARLEMTRRRMSGSPPRAAAVRGVRPEPGSSVDSEGGSGGSEVSRERSSCGRRF